MCSTSVQGSITSRIMTSGFSFENSLTFDRNSASVQIRVILLPGSSSNRVRWTLFAGVGSSSTKTILSAVALILWVLQLGLGSCFDPGLVPPADIDRYSG